MYLTASMLYDYIRCPHKVWRDRYGPQDEKNPETNPFVELLWERGLQHEKETIKTLGEFLDLSAGGFEERFEKTKEAMRQKTPLIYEGVLIYGNLLGIPDLLRLQSDGNYVPIDIKSGMGFEGGDEEESADGKPKPHYAVQLCLYVETLIRLGFAKERKAIILDINRNEAEYDLLKPRGVKTPQTWWEFYEEIKEQVWALLNDKTHNSPAAGSACKLCPWYSSCKKWCADRDDLTCVSGLGRSRRDTINADLGIMTVNGILNLDLPKIMAQKRKDKKFLHGIAEKTIDSFMTRANVLRVTKKPVLHEAIGLPVVATELFFDIEDDPTQEFVYMHGVYERSASGERYLSFIASEVTPEAEERAWKEFWDYVRTLKKDDFAVYYYSHHEKTTYKRMQKKYPRLIEETAVGLFFENPNVNDLYKIVRGKTDWPLWSYSLKDIAQYLGFRWRDETPSGALSIQWYSEYLKTGDEKILNRIKLYNEDDCKATMVLKDALAKIAVGE